MEKRFCPLVGHMVYIESNNHVPEKNAQKHNPAPLAPCAASKKNGVCPGYFAGCCVI